MRAASMATAALREMLARLDEDVGGGSTTAFVSTPTAVDVVSGWLSPSLFSSRGRLFMLSCASVSPRRGWGAGCG